MHIYLYMYIQIVTLNHELNKIKTVMVALSHMISPLAGMKQNQNQNLEAYTHIHMQKNVEIIVDIALFHLNFKKPQRI